ncbi:MAG: CBS domain-containing protein [Peptococcaceae bacterium]|nr:MAG: CBS domain-containing protein [Peptococcaceae bacterium]
MPATHEKKVKDLMIPIEEYSRVNINSTVKEAIMVLKESFCPAGTEHCTGHRSVLVFDDDDNLVGLLTFRSLLVAIEPRFLKVEQWAVPVFWEGLFTERCREEAQKKVKEVMHPITLVTVNAEDTIIKTVYAMIKHKLGALPVVSNGRVVGMIRITEIFNEISELVTNEPESVPA